MMEANRQGKWTERKVMDAGYVYGVIKFQGKKYEPTFPHGFIQPGDKVQVRPLPGGPLHFPGSTARIQVRKVLGWGSYGGVEVWEG